MKGPYSQHWTGTVANEKNFYPARLARRAENRLRAMKNAQRTRKQIYPCAWKLRKSLSLSEPAIGFEPMTC
jgi:hypothetical protein